MGISVEKPEILVNPFSQMETALEHKLRNLKKREVNFIFWENIEIKEVHIFN